MASSSKQRRGSSGKQSSAGKARVISAKRTDALPRKGNVSTSRRKPVVKPPIDATLEPLAIAMATSNKKAPRTKTTRAAGRASGKLKKPAAAAMKPEVEAVAVVEAETELEVEACEIVEETTVVEAPCPPAIEAVTRAAVASPTPPALAPHHGKRGLVDVVSQLLSALRRWTGVR